MFAIFAAMIAESSAIQSYARRQVLDLVILRAECQICKYVSRLPGRQAIADVTEAAMRFLVLHVELSISHLVYDGGVLYTYTRDMKWRRGDGCDVRRCVVGCDMLSCNSQLAV